MLKEKLKRNRETTKIDSELLDACREYCSKNGKLLGFYIDEAIKSKLSEDNK